MPDFVKTMPELAIEYARWFVNRRAYTRQSDTPDPTNGRHYYYRPRRKNGPDLALTRDEIERHFAGEITLGLYAVNPKTQRVKWMAIDADYKKALEDLLKLQYELAQDGIQAALEQSRRGGHLWILFERPVLAKHARRYIRHLAEQLSVDVKGGGLTEGIEIFPKQDTIEANQFGNAIRAPLGIHRATKRQYWFYGAPYDLTSQMEYLRRLARVSESRLRELIADLPEEETTVPVSSQFTPAPGRKYFQITEYIDVGNCRRNGRNWVTQCPSCHAAGKDRGKDNLAISIEEPQKYICWAGCTKQQIRWALGAPLPALAKS